MRGGSWALAVVAVVIIVAALHASPARGDDPCPGYHGPTTGHISVLENPWKHRDDLPIGVVPDDQNFDSSTPIYLTVTGPTGSFEVHGAQLVLKAAELPNGTYTVVGHWQVACIGDGSGNSVPGESSPFDVQIAIPALARTPGIFTDPFHGRKSPQAVSVDGGQYCHDEANMYRDEPFSITVYYTTNGSLPLTTSPRFTDENAHGCSVEPGTYKRKVHRITRGPVTIGGDHTGQVGIGVKPPGKLRALIIARSGGEVVSAIRVRFVSSIGPVPAPGHGTQRYEQVKRDSGSCPVTCSGFHH
jgi:hypothetical protein